MPSSAEREHRRAVDELAGAAAEEDGWHVLELPNLHEGGGTTTWWLHPCDPDRDESRDVTRTAYHGSDVAGLPGVHTVEADTLPCDEPGRDVAMDDGRTVRLDVDVLALGPTTFGLLAEREQVVATDLEHGTTRKVQTMAGRPTLGPCDGRAAWTARLESSAELVLVTRGCADTLAALPADARALLTLPDGDDDPGNHSSATLAADDLDAFDAALVEAGWESDTIEFRSFEGTSHEPYWRGPCGPSYDTDGDSRTEADWHDNHLSVRERPCD